MRVTSFEPEACSPIDTAAMSASSSPDLVSTRATEPAVALHKEEAVDATATQGPTISAQAKYRPITVILAGIVVAGVVVAVVPRRGQNATPRIAQVKEPSGLKPRQSSSLVTDNARPVAAEANMDAIANEPAAASVPPAPSAPPDTTHVTLDLTPVDAKVNIRGRELPGPPFEFDVANGERIAVEAKRPGFVTAKVVIDGKKPLVHFGMLRERWPKLK